MSSPQAFQVQMFVYDTLKNFINERSIFSSTKFCKSSILLILLSLVLMKKLSATESRSSCSRRVSSAKSRAFDTWKPSQLESSQ